MKLLNRITELDKQTKEKLLLWFIFFILICSTGLDLWTAFNTPLYEIAEINPVYLLTGNIWVLIIINIVFVIYFIYMMQKKLSLAKIFFVTIMIAYMSFGHFFGAYSNIRTEAIYEKDPGVFEERHAQVTKQAAAGHYFNIMFVVVVLPAWLSIGSFVIAHKIYMWRRDRREQIISQIEYLVKELGD
jgi:hypothetical protein